MVIVRDRAIVYEPHVPAHDAATASMLFSVTKTITSLLVGAAIDDELIGSYDDPISVYIPELSEGGFDTATVADALAMDTNASYVEDAPIPGLPFQQPPGPTSLRRLLHLGHHSQNVSTTGRHRCLGRCLDLPLRWEEQGFITDCPVNGTRLSGRGD